MQNDRYVGVRRGMFQAPTCRRKERQRTATGNVTSSGYTQLENRIPTTTSLRRLTVKSSSKPGRILVPGAGGLEPVVE